MRQEKGPTRLEEDFFWIGGGPILSPTVTEKNHPPTRKVLLHSKKVVDFGCSRSTIEMDEDTTGVGGAQKENQIPPSRCNNRQIWML